MAEAKVGIIGGSGLYQIEGLTETKEIKIKTPSATRAMLLRWASWKA